MSRSAALKVGGARVTINTPMVDGSILLKGARVDDLRLKQVSRDGRPREPGDRAARPKSTDYPYHAEFGWVGGKNMPNENSVWTQTSGDVLSPGKPVTLTWDNGQGLVFTRVIAIDDKYMFTVADSVANNESAAAVNLYPYGACRAAGRSA